MSRFFITYLIFFAVFSCEGQKPKLVLPIGHYLEITSACFSPEGKKIVTASADNTAKIWDVTSGLLLVDLKGHKEWVSDAQFSFDGKRIVTASSDATAKIWDATTGLVLTTLTGHSGSVYNASFSPDKKKVITTSEDTTVKVWNAESGKLLLNLEGYVEAVFSAAPATFNADGTKIITASEDSTVKIWDAVSGKLLSHILGTVESFFPTAPTTLSPDGKKAFTVSANEVEIRDVATGKLIAEMKGHADQIDAARYSTNGKRIITSNGNYLTKTWDALTGQLLTNFKSLDKESFEVLAFSPDENKIVTCASNSNAAIIWDVANGTILAELNGHDEDVIAAQFSNDGKRIVTASLDAAVKVWDAATGKQLMDLHDSNFGVQSAQFSPDNSKIIATTFVGDAKIWDALTGKLLCDFDGNVQDAAYRGFPASFSPSGKIVVTAGDNHKAKIWNTSTSKLMATLKGHTDHIKAAQFSSDGKKIVTASYDKTVKVWNIITGKLLLTLKGLPDEYFYSAVFSPDDKKIVTASLDNTSKIWDAITGKLITALKGHNGSVMSARFSPDGKRVITASLDNTSKIWNTETSKLIYTFFAIDSSDYLTLLPDGYYQTTQAAAKLLHYVTNDLQIISFEQLDVKYNRPDKVLEAIGNTDTALIKSYRKAYEKRIKKLGIDTTQFRSGYSVPKANFENRAIIDFEQTTDKLTLKIKGSDTTYKLDRFNIWVNEAPLYGQRGISIYKKNTNYIDTTITIKLSQGENKIETSITNVNGTESYRMPLYINYTPEVEQKESVHFIGIGIDQFADNTYNLKYSVKDIRDLAINLKEKYGDDIVIDTLFNQQVTVGNVKAFKKELLKTNENDKVIIAYSGHGMLSKEYDYFLSTYAVKFENPEANGLPYDELENLLDSIPARKKLMLIDACHSGEVDKEDLVTLNASSDSLIKGFKPVAYKDDKHLGLKNSFELMQSLFVNVGKSTGATIISAAAGTQFALERNDLKNGVFTYCILEAMKTNATMKISDLKSIVGKRVEELTKGLQKPTSRNETIATNWDVW